MRVLIEPPVGPFLMHHFYVVKWYGCLSWSQDLRECFCRSWGSRDILDRFIWPILALDRKGPSWFMPILLPIHISFVPLQPLPLEIGIPLLFTYSRCVHPIIMMLLWVVLVGSPCGQWVSPWHRSRVNPNQVVLRSYRLNSGSPQSGFSQFIRSS